MHSVYATTVQCQSLIVEVTFYHTTEDYWGFAHQYPISACGPTLELCVQRLCARLQTLLTAGKRATNRACAATADGWIRVETPYMTPTFVVKILRDDWGTIPKNLSSREVDVHKPQLHE